MRQARTSTCSATCLALAALVSAALLVVRPGPLPAQVTGGVEPGDRLRLYPEGSCSSCSVTGRLERLEGGRLSLRADGELLGFPLDSIRALQRSRGKSWVPPVAGGVGGFFASTGIFLAGFCSDADTSCDGDTVATVALVVGVPAGAIGTLVGLLLADERWADIPLEGLELVTGPGRIGLRLALWPR